MLSSFGERGGWAQKIYSLTVIPQKAPHAQTQNRANKNIRVQYEHLGARAEAVQLSQTFELRHQLVFGRSRGSHLTLQLLRRFVESLDLFLRRLLPRAALVF